MANQNRLASNPFTAFAIGFEDPAAFGEFRAEQQALEAQSQANRQKAKMAAAELYLKNTPIDNPNRDAVEAFLAEALGGDEVAVNIVIGMRPAAAEGFTLGKDQTRFSPTGEVIARGVESPAGASAAKPSEFERLSQRWLDLRERDRQETLSAREKDEIDITFRKLTASEGFQNVLARMLMGGGPEGEALPVQPPQPTQQSGPRLTESQKGWIENGKKAIAAGKDQAGVIEKIRQKTGLSEQQIRGLL